MFSEEALETYLDSFIGGAVVGGGFNIKRLAKSVKNDTDYDTGYSRIEEGYINSKLKERAEKRQKDIVVEEKVQSVIDEQKKTYGELKRSEDDIRADIIAKIDRNGLDISKTKLSTREIDQIEKEIIEELTIGDVTIEEIENYIAAEEKEDIRVLEEAIERDAGKNRELLEEGLETVRNQLNKKMRTSLEKSNLFNESYKQANLSNEKYSVEIKKDDSDISRHAKETASKYMNNTTKHRNFVDYAIKIGERLDINITFVNDESLREYDPALAGKTINGYIKTNKDGKKEILINADSKEKLNFVFGHEVTHALENIEDYKSLAESIKKYSESNYNKRLEEVKKLYDGILTGTDAEIEAQLNEEVVADLVGGYLFTDEKFVKHLAENRTVFQKIYDYIKDSIKLVTKGSQEEKELIKLKRTFEKMMGKVDKTNKTDGETKNDKYSIGYTTKNEPVVVVNDSIDIDFSVFDAENVQNTEKGRARKKEATKKIKEVFGRYRKIPVHGQLIEIGTKGTKEIMGSKDTYITLKKNKIIFEDKMNALAHPFDVLYASTNYINDTLRHTRNDNFVQFAKGEVLLKINGNKYKGKVVIGITDEGIAEIYDVINMKRSVFTLKKKENTSNATDNMPSQNNSPSSFVENIPQSSLDVKGKIKFSISET